MTHADGEAPPLLFTRLDFGFALGPVPGRYLVRPVGAPTIDDSVAGVTRSPGQGDTLLIAETRTTRGVSRPRVRRRARPAAPEPGLALAQTRVTLVESSAIGAGTTAAGAELARRAADLDLAGERAAAALGVLNRAIAAHRIAARDPYVRDVTLEDAERVVVGVGSAADLDGGRWTTAHDLPRPAVASRVTDVQLGATRHVADVLAGRAVLRDVDELLLRVHLDADAGRWMAAAGGLLAVVRVHERDADVGPSKVLDECAATAERVLAGGQDARTELLELALQLDRLVRRERGDPAARPAP